MLSMALGGIFCLSWVGAICDSSRPSCRGNNTLHTAFARTYFIVFDLYMLALVMLPRHIILRCTGLVCCVCARLSACSASYDLCRVATWLPASPLLP